MKWLSKIRITFPFFVIFIFTALNLYLLTLPMTNVLSYEFSAANGIMQCLVAGLLSINRLRKSGPYKFFGEFLAGNKFYFIFIFFFPLIISIVSTILFRLCPFQEGLLFYLIITLPALLFGIVFGWLSFNFSRKLGYLIFIISYLVVCLSPLIELFYNPQIYFYNPLIGFFPGTIYDESIRIDFNLIFYQAIITLFLFTILLFTAKFNKKKFMKLWTLLYIIFLPAAFYFIKPGLNFSTDISRIERELNCKLNTEHFLIYYPENIAQKKIENIALHHEYFYDEIYSELRVKPVRKIVSFLFDSPEQKGRLFGAERADVAKPWLYQIYTTVENYDATLKHELAHIFSAEFGVTFLKLAYMLNPAMIEGLAMAVENDFDDKDVHQIAALAVRTGYKVKITSLFSGLNFFSRTSSLSYIFAGSFIRYLLDNYPVEKIKAVYADMDFRKHFGDSIDDLGKDYYNFLSTVQIDFSKDKANYYFGSQPIFKKFCVRYAANQLRKAGQLFSEGKYYSSRDLFREIYEYSNSFESMSGYYNSLIQLKQCSSAQKILEREMASFENTAYYYNLELNLADLYVRNNNPQKADSIYKIIIDKKPNMDYYNIAFIRRYLLKRNFENAKAYVEGSSFDRYAILDSILIDTLIYEMIPPMLELNKSLRGNYINILQKYASKILVSDTVATYAALKLTKYAIENGDYLTARDFAITGLKESRDDWSHSLKMNLKKANYFINAGEDVKASFRYERIEN
ncbi:MAG: hypothetical protein V1720_03175 [bacterium]